MFFVVRDEGICSFCSPNNIIFTRLQYFLLVYTSTPGNTFHHCICFACQHVLLEFIVESMQVNIQELLEIILNVNMKRKNPRLDRGLKTSMPRFSLERR